MSTEDKDPSALAHAASERAKKAEKPGGPFTVKQAISKALHEKAARLHRKAMMHQKLNGDGGVSVHEAKHREHYEALEKFNVR